MPIDIKAILKIIFNLIILAVIGYAGWFLYKKIKAVENRAGYTGADKIRKNFNPKVLAGKMYDVISGVFTAPSTKDSAALEVNAINDAELTQVYNAYSESFSNTETLTAAMRNEFVNGSDNWAILLDRLEKLNLP